MTLIQKPDDRYVTNGIIENKGQKEKPVLFYTQNQSQYLYFLKDKIVADYLGEVSVEQGHRATHAGVVLSLAFLDTSDETTVSGSGMLTGKYNYFKGNDPKQWIRNACAYETIRYTEIWTGVSLEVVTTLQGYKLNWMLSQPKNITQIKLQWRGADEIRLTENGDLEIHHPFGVLTDPAPQAWQIDGQRQIPVVCSYTISLDGVIGFEIRGEYNENLPLVIDPMIPFATYLAGVTEGAWTRGQGMAVDAEGYTYLAGITEAPNFPVTPGAYSNVFPGEDTVYITKFNLNGTGLIYSTLLGGIGYLYDLKVDEEGNAYIVGFSYQSEGYPLTPGAFISNPLSTSFAIVTKLNAEGSDLIYSTALCGSTVNNSSATARGLFLNDSGEATVVGYTYASDFPITPGAFQTTNPGNVAVGFATQLNQDGSDILRSTLFGGTDGTTRVTTVMYDEQGNLYLGGETSSTTLPVSVGAVQTALSGTQSGFAAKLNEDFSTLIFSTYFGSNGTVQVHDLQVTPEWTVYICGETNATGLVTTPGAYKSTYGGNDCGFITHFNADGTSLIASSYTTQNGETAAMVFDKYGNLYTAGQVFADVHMWVMDAGLTRLISDTFICDATFMIEFIELSPDGVYYYIGGTSSGSLATSTDSYMTDYPGSPAAFVVRNRAFLYNQASIKLEGIL